MRGSLELLALLGPLVLVSLVRSAGMALAANGAGMPERPTLLIDRPRLLTTIRFSLSADGSARVVIPDPQGRRIHTLVDHSPGAGLHDAIRDGTDEAGHPAAPGSMKASCWREGMPRIGR